MSPAAVEFFRDRAIPFVTPVERTPAVRRPALFQNQVHRGLALVPGDLWFPHARPPGQARVRLFSLPYAGGGASAYGAWLRASIESIDFCPIQLPGREGRLAEPPFRRMAPCVMALAEVLTCRLDLPYAIFGHSMGAILAFELVRELRRRDACPPVRLFVSAHRGPRLGLSRGGLSAGTDEELVADLRRLGGTSEEILSHAEMMHLVLPLYRADAELCETWSHTHEAPLEIPISAFGGRDDPDVTPAELQAWRHETTADFRLHVFPGAHFFIHRNAPSVLGRIAADLLATEQEPAARGMK